MANQNPDPEAESEAMQLRSQSPDRDGEQQDDYDPHLHRDLPKPTNNMETLCHLLKCSVGTGILAMPQAFARAGLVTAVLTTLCGGVLVTHSLRVLVAAQYECCRRRRVPHLSYPAAMSVALEEGPPTLRRLARPAAVLVDIFLVVYQLGICCVYIVFIAENIKKVVDPYQEMSVVIHMLIILGPLVAFNLIPNLKMLAPFSAFAILLTVIGLAIVVYYLIKLEHSREPLDLFGTLAAFPLFFGTMLFALTTVGVVVALENNMKTPKSFGKPFGVLNVGMSIIVLMYLTMGVLGDLYCKSSCSDSITLDLPSGWLANVVLVVFAVAMFISYGLQCFVPVEVLWNGYLRPRLEAGSAAPRPLACAQYAVRIGLCLLTFVLAAAVPQLGLFISLFGALCLSALGLCFPAVMDSCLAWGGPRRSRARHFKNALLFLVGLVGLVAGTYSALFNIIRTFIAE